MDSVTVHPGTLKAIRDNEECVLSAQMLPNQNISQFIDVTQKQKKKN